MKRVKLIVSYDGTNYHGWQVQPNGITIEEVLNKVLTELLQEPIQVIGASRTDSGVHALGNVAVFDTSNRMPAERICFAMNQRLPQDIRIQMSEEVALDWHPRKQNCIKTYEYQILNQKIDHPLLRLYSHFCYMSLDVEKMKNAADFLIGEHDFKSFCTVRAQAEETVRTIYQIEIVEVDALIKIRISGNGFLYNMVRIIIGTLIKVGVGAYPPEYLQNILDARDRNVAGPKISAKGLTLLKLDYEKVLAPFIEGDNKYWNYILWQNSSDQNNSACFIIRRCADQEFQGVVRRILHQAYRNGIKKIVLIDCEKDRIKTGDSYGYYQIGTPLDWELIREKWSREINREEKEIIRRLMELGKRWYSVENR